MSQLLLLDKESKTLMEKNGHITSSKSMITICGYIGLGFISKSRSLCDFLVSDFEHSRGRDHQTWRRDTRQNDLQSTSRCYEDDPVHKFSSILKSYIKIEKAKLNIL